jgi:hypothetical protein
MENMDMRFAILGEEWPRDVHEGTSTVEKGM